MTAIDLGELSFYWRMADRPAAPSPVPKFLPFAFDFDADTRLITQRPDARVQEILRRTYLEDHNIGYMQPGHALADRYGQDFLRFIDQCLNRRDRPARRVLDVGCGGCYLLRELAARGYEAHGIDPGPVTARFAAEFGIPVATGFYPVAHPFGRMDVVLSSGILEHVPDPVAFLRAHHDDLREDGDLIVSVPDSTPSIERGDVSMILHEHISYFDEESLRRVVAAAGFEVLDVSRAAYGASLYCRARVPAGRGQRDHLPDTPKGDKFATVARRLRASLDGMRRYVEPLLGAPGVSLGFYVPLRPLPYLSIMKRFGGFRFFDDDPGVHGKYFDGFDVPVENFQDFRDRPPTHVAVMSLPHAPAIEKKVRGVFGDRVAVTSLADIIAN